MILIEVGVSISKGDDLFFAHLSQDKTIELIEGIDFSFLKLVVHEEFNHKLRVEVEQSVAVAEEILLLC